MTDVFLTFIVANDISCLREQLATWGREERSYDPPRYACGGLIVTAVPMPPVIAQLSVPIDGEGLCLDIDPAMVSRWCDGELDGDESRCVHEFVNAIAPRTYAAVFTAEQSAREPVIAEVSASALFARLVERIRGEIRTTIFRVSHGRER